MEFASRLRKAVWLRILSAVSPLTSLNILSFTAEETAGIIRKALDSAIANAEHNNGADIDELRVTSIYVEKATTLRRFSARAKGRGARIGKQTCHIYVTVGDTPAKK